MPAKAASPAPQQPQQPGGYGWMRALRASDVGRHPQSRLPDTTHANRLPSQHPSCKLDQSS